MTAERIIEDSAYLWLTQCNMILCACGGLPLQSTGSNDCIRCSFVLTIVGCTIAYWSVSPLTE